MNALDRGQAMLLIPMKDLPPLALDYAKHLSKRVGMCLETLLTAWTTYAHLEEGLPLDGPDADLYASPPNEVEIFKTLKAARAEGKT